MTNTGFSAQHTLYDAVHGTLPWAALHPGTDGPLPVCLFLFGGGGSVDSLEAIAPLLREGWSTRRLHPMIVACLGVDPFCFYLDAPRHGMHWESAVSHSLLDAVQARFPTSGRNGLVGISMGGYGALKIAFRKPDIFAAVAAMAPMLEPSCDAQTAPLRNRFHYPPDVPAALLGSERDAELFAADHPVTRARHNAKGIREHNLAIWMDAGSRDSCHAHDGTEWLHRVLWQLDIAHGYTLLRDADHVGPSLIPRLERAFAFVGGHLSAPSPPPSPEEQALRATLSGARATALSQDASVARTYGALPPEEW